MSVIHVCVLFAPRNLTTPGTNRMCSYNKVNNVWACEANETLIGLLRSEGFQDFL